MCGRATREYVWGEVSELAGQIFDEPVLVESGVAGLARSFNVAPTQETTVLRACAGCASGVRASVLRWGLVPGWARDGSMRTKMINARSETVAQKPSFRDAFRSRRCVVPFSSFYEWEQSDKGRGKKQPHRVVRADGEMMWMAGLWEANDIAFGQRVETFCVVTAEARGRMAELHHRVPVILEKEAIAHWMGPDDDAADAVMTSNADGLLDTYPVDKRVGRVGENDARLIDRVAVEEQGGLFG